MNILFVSTHLNTGGITSYLLTLTRGMLARGHHVYVATSGGDMEATFQLVGAELFTVDLKTKSILSPKISRGINRLKKYIEEHDIDVIHAQTRITQVLAQRLSKETRLTYISTCHGFFNPKISRRLFPCWGDCVIAISPAVVDHLKEDLWVHADQIALVKSGVHLEQFIQTDEIRRKEAKSKLKVSDKLVIGNVARLSDVKGQDILVQAMKNVIEKIPNAVLFLYGGGKLEGLLKRLVDKLNLTDYVEFYPVVNQTNQSLAAMDLFVNPSRSEGLGLSVMEAQATGLCVVATDVGGITSIIQNDRTGILVESENHEALADAIIKILKDPQKRESIGAAAREFIINECSADQMVDKTLSIYEKYSCR